MYSPSDSVLPISQKPLKFVHKICILHDVNFHSISITTEKPRMLKSQIPEKNHIVMARRRAESSLINWGWKKKGVMSETPLL